MMNLHIRAPQVLNDGASVTDVARRSGAARQTVHGWLRAYATGGLGGLAVNCWRMSSANCPPASPGPGVGRPRHRPQSSQRPI